MRTTMKNFGSVSLLLPLRQQRFWFWALASTAGFVQCWSYRYWIESDGVNYLDVACAYLRHDWSAAINSYWSPFYSWLLAAVFLVVRPTPNLESTVLHLVNFLLFIGALLCGEFFLRELIRDRADDSLPEWALWSIGYSLLLFVSLFMNSAYLDTPDLCTSALVYLAGGLLIRIRSGRATTLAFVLFGVTLGLAYFSKTVMFLVAFAFLAAAGIRRGTLLAAGCFAVVILPWIVILSHAAGHMTYGDAGSANYIKYVSYSGSPVHPPRLIANSPEVREFATPIRATYPLWYASPYWIEGLHPRLDLKTQYTVLRNNFRYYLHLLTGQKEFIAGFALIFIGWPILTGVRWHLLLPSLWGFFLYGLIHVEPRLVGVFFFIFGMTLFWSLRVRSRRLVILATLLIVFVTAFKVVKADVLVQRHVENSQWQTAAALKTMGLVPHSLVAVFGHGDEGDYWAHLGGFRVVADIETENLPSYWSASTQDRAQIIKGLEKLNVRAVICTKRPGEDGWQFISGSPGYYVRFLNPTSSENTSAEP
jgi:hypothetical protein